MRIRTLKPDFWTNEKMAGISPLARLLAIALLNWADDEGYFLAAPAQIRGAVFPFHDDSRSIHGALTELEKLNYIQIRINPEDGRKYGHILHFLKHQVVNRPYPSKIKALFDSFSERSVNTHGALTAGMGKGMGNRLEWEREIEPPKPPSALFEIPASLQNDRFRIAFDLWEKHRKEIKKPNTPTARTQQLNKCAEWGIERAIKAIEHSIAGGYQGIFEPNQNGNSNGNGNHAPKKPMSEDDRMKAGLEALGFSQTFATREDFIRKGYVQQSDGTWIIPEIPKAKTAQEAPI